MTEETKDERRKRKQRDYQAAYRLKNPGKAAKASAAYRARNLEARRQQSREYMARKRAEDPEWVNANNARYRVKVPDKVKQWSDTSYRRNHAKHLARQAEYRRNNAEKVAKVIKDWAERNPEKRREYVRKSRQRPEAKAMHSARQGRRNAQKLKATPAWANPEKMLEFYKEARKMQDEYGLKCEVDHIVPLISKVVCGLHWEGNLRVLTEFENRSKGNRRWENMW